MRLSTIIAATRSTVGTHDREFQRARAREPSLAPYATAMALFEAIPRAWPRDLEQFEPVVLALLREHQRSHHPLWQALLLRVFEPMLVRLRVRLRCRDWEDRGSMLLLAFLEVISSVSPEPGRAFLSVRCATGRAVFEAARAQDLPAADTAAFDEDSPECAPPVHLDPAPFLHCLAHELVEQMARRRGGEDVARLLAGVETVGEQLARIGEQGKAKYRCLQQRRGRTLKRLRAEMADEQQSA